MLVQLKLSAELAVKALLATDFLAKTVVPAGLFIGFTFNFVPVPLTRFWKD